MSQSDQDLLNRLKERIKDPRRATDDDQHPAKVYRPASSRLVQSTEKRLGFRLPKLLQRIYTQVGNGGFGPFYGFVGLEGGARLDGKTLVSLYEYLTNLESENEIWKWPDRLLPVCSFGCGDWVCIDCGDARLRLFMFDPNNLQEELDGEEAKRNWANAFWNMGEFFRSWLEMA
jgi:SMI1 / KNR4 family (SUKH-1)